MYTSPVVKDISNHYDNGMRPFLLIFTQTVRDFLPKLPGFCVCCTYRAITQSKTFLAWALWNCIVKFWLEFSFSFDFALLLSYRLERAGGRSSLLCYLVID